MSGARHDGPYRAGQRLQMTQAWKDRVEAELAARGHNRAWLAERLGVTRGKITKLFKRNPDGSMHQVSSEAVAEICQLLDIPRPLMATPDEPDPKDARLLELVRDAPAELKDAAIAMLEAYFRVR